MLPSDGTTVNSGVGIGESQPVSAADVAQAYLLILGRAAESSEVIASKVGQDPPTMLRGFLTSDEFLGGTLAALLTNDDHRRLKRIKPSTDLWARTFFDLPQGARPVGTRQATADLFAALLALPVIAAIVENVTEPGTVGRAIAGAQSIAAMVQGDAIEETTSEDLRNLYRLVHDREPESFAVVRPRPDQPLDEVLADFLAAREFAARIVEIAVSGRNLSLDKALVKWTARRFGIEAGDNFGERAVLRALIVRSANRLRARSLLWSIDDIVAALGDADRAVYDPLYWLQQISTCAQIVATSGIAPGEAAGSVVFTDDDPWLLLRPMDVDGDFLEIDFQVTLETRNARGSLYLDYGRGFLGDTVVRISYDNNGCARVRIPVVDVLRDFRWDPCDTAGRGSIGKIAIRAVTELESDHGRNIVAELMDEAKEDPALPVTTAIARALSRSPNGFEQWAALNEPIGANAHRIWQAQLAELETRPLISVLMPTYNTDERLLCEAIESVRAQVYPDWELCIADDASTAPHVRTVLKRYAALDKRIRVNFRRRNGHISEASNSALELVRGQWTALLDHDDLLTPNALLAVAQEIGRHPDAELIYSDEDKMSLTGHRQHPFFKADFSPELLLSQNYINHLTVHRTENLRAVGGWRKGFEGSQDWDITLRIVERVSPDTIRHIPLILYHWRVTPGSTALNVSEKSYAVDAGLKSVQEHLARTGKNASAEIMTTMAFNRVRYALPSPPPKVSLIVPTRDRVDLLQMSVGSILDQSTYSDFEILIVDNNSSEAATFDYFKKVSADPRVRVIPFPGEFDFAAINNEAARRATGEILGLVNNDIEVITSDWIEELASWAWQPEIGCVGAKLYYPDGRIQHGGIVLGIGRLAGHGHKFSPGNSIGHYGRLKLHNNVSAVTGACLFVRRAVFEEVGGLDPALKVAFNDVDFCIKVREAGYRNIFTPFAELVHHESVSRGYEDTPEKAARLAREGEYLREKWGDLLLEDPLYSPNLTLDREDYSIGISPFQRQFINVAAPR